VFKKNVGSFCRSLQMTFRFEIEHEIRYAAASSSQNIAAGGLVLWQEMI